MQHHRVASRLRGLWNAVRPRHTRRCHWTAAVIPHAAVIPAERPKAREPGPMTPGHAVFASRAKIARRGHTPRRRAHSFRFASRSHPTWSAAEAAVGL